MCRRRIAAGSAPERDVLAAARLRLVRVQRVRLRVALARVQSAVCAHSSVVGVRVDCHGDFCGGRFSLYENVMTFLARRTFGQFLGNDYFMIFYRVSRAPNSAHNYHKNNNTMYLVFLIS